MGVYIDMEMPTSCFYCPFRIKVDPDNIKCLVSGVVFEETFTESIEMRHSGDCPLIPVQQHGRLIDADALEKLSLPRTEMIDGEIVQNRYVSLGTIRQMPTIIPAEDE